MCADWLIFVRVTRSATQLLLNSEHITSVCVSLAMINGAYVCYTHHIKSFRMTAHRPYALSISIHSMFGCFISLSSSLFLCVWLLLIVPISISLWLLLCIQFVPIVLPSLFSLIHHCSVTWLTKNPSVYVNCCWCALYFGLFFFESWSWKFHTQTFRVWLSDLEITYFNLMWIEPSMKKTRTQFQIMEVIQLKKKLNNTQQP